MCVYICHSLCACAYICFSVCVCVTMYVCLNVSMYTCMHVSLYVHVCLSLCVAMCLSVCKYVCVCMFTYMHVCTCSDTTGPLICYSEIRKMYNVQFDRTHLTTSMPLRTSFSNAELILA